MTESRGSLIIQTAFIGDLALTIPFLLRLRSLYPHEPISLIARKGIGEFLLKLKLIDELHEVEKGNTASYHAATEILKVRNFRFLFGLHRSFRSAQLARQIKSEKKIGFKSWWAPFFYQNRIEHRKDLPEALRQLNLLSPLDSSLESLLDTGSNKQTASEFLLGSGVPSWASMNCRDRFLDYKTEINRLREKLGLTHWSGDQDGKLVVVFPGSVWTTKRWTESGFVDVICRQLQLKNRVLLMGSQSEFELCDRIKSHVTNSLEKEKYLVNLAGHTNLFESLLIVSTADLVLSNDSGSMHLASLAGVPVVAIFGPTVLAQGFRPWNSQSRVVQNSEVTCRPCGAHGHMSCPKSHHKCMVNLNSSVVLDTIDAVLK